MAKNYDLEFVPAAKVVGLRGSSVAENDPNPVVITRELIQNALDARVGTKTEISFDLGMIPLAELPGIEKYRKAFEAIDVKPHDKTIAETIESCLAEKEIQVLWVKDKGQGLDGKNMNKLLDDGNSDKPAGLGSYGVGHLAAFLASKLRYVIYGGCSSEGQILSGHSILATFGPGTKARGPDGYIIKETEQLNIFDRQFPKFSDLEKGIWKKELAEIKKDGTGSFVCITAFNHFLDEEANDQKTEKDMAYAAACHFMLAIFEGKMNARIGNIKLTKQSLEDIISSRKHIKRRAETSEYGVAGARFYNLYECLRREKSIEVPLSNKDNVKVFLDKAPSHDRAVVHLYRQGMWITGRIPGLTTTDFNNYRPFTAIILVDKEKSPGLNRLITSAEGPKHVEINAKKMRKNDKADMQKYFSEIKKALGKEIKQNKSRDVPSNILQHSRTGVSKIPPGGRYNARFPRSESSGSSESSDQDNSQNHPGTKSNRKGKQLRIRNTYSIDGNKIQVAGRSDQDYREVEISLSGRSGSDESCENPVADKVVFLKEGGESGGALISENAYISRGDEKKYSAVKLGDIKAGDFVITLVLADPPPSSRQIYEVVFTSMAKGRQ